MLAHLVCRPENNLLSDDIWYTNRYTCRKITEFCKLLKKYLCHFSQFVYNVPVLMRGGRVGVAYWPVLKGPMLRIFVIDAALFVANLGAALLLASRS